MKAAGVVKVATKSDATSARVKPTARVKKRSAEGGGGPSFYRSRPPPRSPSSFFLAVTPAHVAPTQFPRPPRLYLGDSFAGAITYLAHEISARVRVFPLRIRA